MESGKLKDGTPWVAIGADEPEAKEFMVWTRCPECGGRIWFDLWQVISGREAFCGGCGHRVKVKVAKVD